jgi:hypothetical protein
MRAMGQRALGFHQIQLKHTNDLRCVPALLTKSHPPFPQRDKKLKIETKENKKGGSQIVVVMDGVAVSRKEQTFTTDNRSSQLLVHFKRLLCTFSLSTAKRD